MKHPFRPRTLAACLAAALPTLAAATETTLPEVTVGSRRGDLVGVADAASEGIIDARRLATRPLLRPAEALETVPGLVVTQHSGDGKANQYFLRGFNLDHGSDFATFVAGMPVNMPSHAHGQGYMDLNFLIPELIAGIRFRKGIATANFDRQANFEDEMDEHERQRLLYVACTRARARSSTAFATSRSAICRSAARLSARKNAASARSTFSGG